MSFWTDVWNIFRNYYPQLLQGVGNTMLIALTGTLAGLLIGLLTGVVRTAPLSRSSVLRLLQRLLNGLIAGLPQLIAYAPVKGEQIYMQN